MICEYVCDDVCGEWFGVSRWCDGQLLHRIHCSSAQCQWSYLISAVPVATVH